MYFVMRMVMQCVITWSFGLPSGIQVAFEKSVVRYHIEMHQARGATDADLQVWKLAELSCILRRWFPYSHSFM
jgi:hypothetical protein